MLPVFLAGQEAAGRIGVALLGHLLLVALHTLQDWRCALQAVSDHMRVAAAPAIACRVGIRRWVVAAPFTATTRHGTADTHAAAKLLNIAATVEAVKVAAEAADCMAAAEGGRMHNTKGSGQYSSDCNPDAAADPAECGACNNTGQA